MKILKVLQMPVFKARAGKFFLYCLPSVALFFYAHDLPTPALLIYAFQVINIVTALCYTLIPAGLRTESLHGLLEVRLGPSLTERFGQFIEACGVHHYWHWPAMIVMASGFMHIRMGQAAWYNYLEAYGGAFVLFAIDGVMMCASLATLIAGRRDVVRREGE